MASPYENVRLMIADPSPMVRTGLKAALHSFGFRNISDTSSFVRLHDMFEQGAMDLLITSSELEGNQVGFLVQEMRNQRLGHNPFLMVMGLLSSAEPDYVRRVIDSGVDDLVLTPVVPDQLMSRIEKLARTRKPFVVTHDYTGPDRRSKPRADLPSAPMLEVPNILKLRAQHGVDATRLEAAIRDTSAALNRTKVERYGVQIEWLVTHIHTSVRDNVGEADELQGHTSHLAAVCEDMLRRLKSTELSGISPLVDDVLNASKAMYPDLAKVPFSELERLHEIAKRISRALGSPPASVGTRPLGATA